MKAALFALLTLGAVVRIGGAWLFRHSYNSDQGIVALMAKHIAEGKSFPTFFYGQAYMGSLEPAVSGLLCFLFGYSGFMVCLGTAIVGFLLLPVVYAMGTQIAGRSAGLVALAFCIAGPLGYFHYMHSPRGGYAITLLFGVFLLWFGGRLAWQRLSGREPGPWGYLLLGLVAGLGWWSNQLISAALLATGLLFLVVLARRAFGWYILPVVGGFALGILPLLVWNHHHDWASFAFLGSLKTATFFKGLQKFFLYRLPAILESGFHNVPNPAEELTGRFLGGQGYRVSAVLYGGTSAAALVWYLRRLYRDRWTLQTVQMTGLLLFVLASILQFSSSSFAFFNTPRYLLPLVPVIGIIVGVGSARLARPLRYGAFLPVLVLIAWQTVRVRDVFGQLYSGHEAFYASARQLGADLREQGVKVVYVPFLNHALNAALEEEFCFSNIKGERYAPYAERAEQSDEIAVLGNVGNVAEFVQTNGGSLAMSGSGRHIFLHGFKIPPGSTREVPPALWREAGDQGGSKVRDPLTDGDSDSVWHAQPPAKGEPASLEVSFSAPTALSRVRLMIKGRFPAKSRWEIQGRDGGAGGRWTSLAAETPITEFYWSGPRPYFGGDFSRLESRFPPAQVDAFRILLHFESSLPVDVAEITAFGPGGAGPVPEQQALPQLREVLAARRVTRLFCDRWVANALRRSPGNTVVTPEEKGIFAFTLGKAVDPRVTLAPSTALLVREEDLEICRRTLAGRGIAMRETTIGPWVLLDFSPQGAGSWVESYRADDSLLWTGFACLTRGPKSRPGGLSQPGSPLPAVREPLPAPQGESLALPTAGPARGR